MCFTPHGYLWATIEQFFYTAKNVLTRYGSVAKKFCYRHIFGTESVLQQHQDSIRSVRTYLYQTCMNSMSQDCFCRTDTDPDLLFSIKPIVFLGTDLAGSVLIQNVRFCCVASTSREKRGIVPQHRSLGLVTENRRHTENLSIFSLIIFDR